MLGSGVIYSKSSNGQRRRIETPDEQEINKQNKEQNR